MDDLSLTLSDPDGSNLRTISGWNQVRVTAGIESCPRSFDIAFTELYPGDAEALTVAPGDACQVSIGGDLVVTGYVDTYLPSIDPSGHMVRLTGRGKCQDLVDCAAVWPGGQISNATAQAIAQQLANYYNVPVNIDPAVGPLPNIYQINIMQGETTWEIVERVCRWSALLAYDQPDGSLYLAQAGKVQHASGAQQGANVTFAESTFSMADRYSEYVVFLQSVDQFHELGDGGNQLTTEQDTDVKRPRRRVIIAEAGSGGINIAQQRATWERLRRAGRSNAIRVTVDSWRDSAGTLWTPNQLVPVNVPACKVGGDQAVNWLLTEVTFRRDEGGTVAELVLMPPEAMLVEPTLQLPPMSDVVTGLGGAAQ